MENSKGKVVWSEEMDNLWLKEEIQFEPYQYKPRTKENYNAWHIADSLCKRF